MDVQMPSLPAFLTFFLFITTVLVILRRKLESNNQRSTPNLPPGPWKLPFIGNLHQLVGSLPHHRLTELSKKYGTVMQLQLGEVPTVVISSPEAAKELLKTQGVNFADKPQLLLTAIVFYNCSDIFFAPYGDQWKQLRKICVLKLLTAKRVQSFRSIREEEVSKFVKSISSKEGLPINLSKMFSSLLNAIVARASIGKKYKNQEAFLPIIEKLIPTFVGFNVADIFPSVKLFDLISWTKIKIKRVHREADKMLQAIIDERRAKNMATETSKNESEDLLGVLLNLQQHGETELPITTENIKSIILEMFIGGSETTSTTLEWAFSEMVKHPRVMEKAQKEVREVFVDMETIEETRLHELKYLKLIIKETMRLHPSGPLIPRECRNRSKINGYDIHAKSRVMINVWALGRDPDYWSQAEKFQPERFLDSSVDYRGSNFEFIPFGAGMRICPGMMFGMVIIELVLANLLYHFDWKLPDGVDNENLDMAEVYGGTARRKRDLYLIPKPCRPSTSKL